MNQEEKQSISYMACHITVGLYMVDIILGKVKDLIKLF